MKLSEIVYMCKPRNNPTDPLHWSEEFITNFWLWKTACDCCRQWRLFISGATIGLFPFMVQMLFAKAWWIVLPYVAFVGAMLVTGYFNSKEGRI